MKHKSRESLILCILYIIEDLLYYFPKNESLYTLHIEHVMFWGKYYTKDL